MAYAKGVVLLVTVYRHEPPTGGLARRFPSYSISCDVTLKSPRIIETASKPCPYKVARYPGDPVKRPIAIRKATPENASASNTAVVSLESWRSASARGICTRNTQRKIM